MMAGGDSNPAAAGILARAASLIGLNRSIVLAGGPRMMGMLLGPIGSIIIVFTLTTAQQGMYYVFLSLLGLRSFFELGATACIGQLTPHHLKDGIPSAGMVAVAGRWMRRVATAFGICALGGGTAYLWWCGYKDLWTHALWAAAVLPTALSGVQEGRLQLLYGSGQVDEVSKIRWWALLFQYGVQWVMLLCGAGLLAFSCAALAVAIGQEWRLRKRHRWLFEAGPDGGDTRALWEQMGSLVRRASVVYLAGYFVLQIQQPILFRWCGAEASARFGFTFTVVNSLLGTAAIWGTIGFPGFARLVAEGQVTEGFRRFRRIWLQALMVASLALGASILAVEILRWIPRFHDRLLPLSGMIPLALAVWIQTVGNCATHWPRSFKQEPFAPTAILQMILTPPAVWAAVRFLGPDSVGWANLLSWIAGGLSILAITLRYLPGKPSAQAFSNEAVVKP